MLYSVDTRILMTRDPSIVLLRVAVHHPQLFRDVNDVDLSELRSGAHERGFDDRPLGTDRLCDT